MANPFDSWIDGAPVVQSGNTDSGDFAKWIDGHPVLETVGARTTFLTPSTGELTTAGQQVHLRPLRPAQGSLSLVGQAAVPRRTTFIQPAAGALTTAAYSVGVASSSDLVSEEYTGDGAGSRSFSSARFSPLAVIVIGKDGSGNAIGAIKTADMPAGKSQPFVQNAAASAASRSNRITSLDASGFTVGADLNVTGRKYAYIMFPAGRASTVNAGSFVGPGGRDTSNGNISTDVNGNISAANNFFTADDCDGTAWQHPGGSTVYAPGVPLVTGGRRLIRTSDGAVVAECLHFIGQQSATGNVYVVVANTQCHFEEYYVDLPGFAGGTPDMLLYFSDDTSADQQPLTVVTPAFMASTNVSWFGFGAGGLFAYLVAGDGRLHVTNDQPLLTKGVRFHWLAFKADEAATGVKMALFQYTSDGAARSITGLDFAPEWAFAFSQNFVGHFVWTKKTTNIVGSNTARLWNDGSGDLGNHGNTFNADGFSVPVFTGNEAFNLTGAKYTIFLLFANPARVESSPQAGALALVGNAPTVVAVATVLIAPNTAELHLAGKQATVTPNVTRITPSTGSLIIAMKSPIRAQKRVIRPSAAALAFTGKAAKTKETHTPGPPPKKFHETPDTGELQITGRQPVLKRGIIPGTGALNLTGRKPFVRPPDSPIFTQTGSLTLTGKAPQPRITITPSTGALVVDGQAGIVKQSVPPRITINTGVLGLVGRQPVLDTSLIPEPGDLELHRFDPIIETNVTKITPIAGDLSISGVSPATNPDVAIDFRVTPFTGDLNLQGQEPIVRETSPGDEFITPQTGALTLTGQQAVVQTEGDHTITPACGALNLVGRPCIVQTITPVPPIPPVPFVDQSGGVGLPTPRKLPFWPKTIIRVRGRILGPPATFQGQARAEENEWEIIDQI